MASPSLSLVCCALRFTNPTNLTQGNRGDVTAELPYSPAKPESLVALQYVYNIAAILSSCLGILATVYILCPKQTYVPVPRRSFRSMERQRKVLTWLSVADVVACFGVLTMGIAGLSELDSFEHEIRNDLPFKWTCIVSAAWIQYFYVATYFWTFFYAIDVNIILRGINRDLFHVYFILAWGLPVVMVFAGLYPMYRSTQFTMECDSRFQSWPYLLPHYLVSYIPMLIVLLINPLLYCHSAGKVGPLLMGSGIYTDKERKIQSHVQQKFFLTVLIFTICWTPNVINGCLLLSDLTVQNHGHSYRVFTGIIWVAMAITNPLQAFFNALVYWGPAGCSRSIPNQVEEDNTTYIVDDEHNFMSNNFPDGTESLDEREPLMRPEREGNR